MESRVIENTLRPDVGLLTDEIQGWDGFVLVEVEGGDTDKAEELARGEEPLVTSWEWERLTTTLFRMKPLEWRSKKDANLS